MMLNQTSMVDDIFVILAFTLDKIWCKRGKKNPKPSQVADRGLWCNRSSEVLISVLIPSLNGALNQTREISICFEKRPGSKLSWWSSVCLYMSDVRPWEHQFHCPQHTQHIHINLNKLPFFVRTLSSFLLFVYCCSPRIESMQTGGCTDAGFPPVHESGFLCPLIAIDSR